MKKVKNYNIFWFVIDSVRALRTNRKKDNRDRLDIMDEFGKDSVEFTNCFTSAPSSLLAAGALYTGLPSVFIARHFNDWRFDNNNINTIATLVDKYNYQSYPLLNARLERVKYKNLLPPLEAKHLPKGFRLSDYVWRNSEITLILEHLLKNGIPRSPFCFTFWYDCRRDPKTSEHVGRALELIKEYGYNNSIIIMTSDHGYPDPETNLNEDFFKNLGHDAILTDDNIRTPLLLKYPGSPVNIKIPNIVGHIDIIPTIFDILNIPYKKLNTRFQGLSLLPIIRGEEKDDSRIIRSDTRLSMDLGKITALRSKRYKYMYFYDENQELLYDLIGDPRELDNLLKNEKEKYCQEINQFRNLKREYEKELYAFHQTELNTNAQKSFASLQKKYFKKKAKILIVSKASEELLNILAEIIKNLFTSPELEVLYGRRSHLSNLKVNKIYQVDDFTVDIISKLGLKKYSIVIYLTQNSSRVFLKKEIIKEIKYIFATHHCLMDFNFKLFNYFTARWFPSSARIFFNWEEKGYFYRQDPLYFFKDLIWFVKTAFSMIFKNKDEDKIAAKDIIDFRNYFLQGGKTTELSENEIIQLHQGSAARKTRDS